MSRRTLLRGWGGAVLLAPVAACAAPTATPTATPAPPPSPAAVRAAAPTGAFTELEGRFDARLGVFAIDTGTGREIGHRADELFPLLSTFKALAAAAVLDRMPERLDERVPYGPEVLLPNSPITQQHVGAGLTLRELCDATVRYSDNAAGNLILAELGGPGAITDLARSLGDPLTRLDRTELELNTAIPGDERDTTTPRAAAGLLRELVLGDRLPAPRRAVLVDWLVRNTTGDRRIRAGLPADWRVGDKTGTGAYGTANDIAVAWPPDGAPVVLAVYTARPGPVDEADEALLAEATTVAVTALLG